jgi:hypothetical protein
MLCTTGTYRPFPKPAVQVFCAARGGLRAIINMANGFFVQLCEIYSIQLRIQSSFLFLPYFFPCHPQHKKKHRRTDERSDNAQRYFKRGDGARKVVYQQQE